MKIVIAGDGDTGSHLAEMLSVEDQDIVLMGTDSNRLADLDSTGNFLTFEGSPLSRANLLTCGVDVADLFVAVTPEETVNLMACQIAKDCGAAKCVARVDRPEFDSEKDFFASHGIDTTIYPERLAAIEILRFIKHNWVSDWFQFHHGAIYVLGVRMEPQGSLCGRRLKDLGFDQRLFHVAAIRRGEKIIIPRGDDSLLADDLIYFAVLPENIPFLADFCGKKTIDASRIMVSGAGHVTENLLSLASSSYSFTVIDPDSERCSAIAAQFPKTVVVNTGASDVATLKEEGVGRSDIFLALTGSSEKNIVSCMVAREHGVAKTLARIEKPEYIPEAQSLSIDKIINKRMINAGCILNILFNSNIPVGQCVSIGNAEIAEVIVQEGSRIMSRTVGDHSLPREFTIAGLVRDGVGHLVEGRTRIQAGDHVILFCVSGALPKVSRYFK